MYKYKPPSKNLLSTTLVNSDAKNHENVQDGLDMYFDVRVPKFHFIAAIEKIERHVIKFRPLELEKLRSGDISYINKLTERFMRMTKPFDIKLEFVENSLRIWTFFYSTTIPATGTANTSVIIAGQPMLMIYRTFSNKEFLQVCLIDNIPEAVDKYLCKIDSLRFPCNLVQNTVTNETKFDEQFMLCYQ